MDALDYLSQPKIKIPRINSNPIEEMPTDRNDFIDVNKIYNIPANNKIIENNEYKDEEKTIILGDNIQIFDISMQRLKNNHTLMSQALLK